jgi:hypothetical protein
MIEMSRSPVRARIDAVHQAAPDPRITHRKRVLACLTLAAAR